MVLTPVETARRSRAGVNAARITAGLAILAGLLVVFTPFTAGSTGKADAPAYSCGSSLQAINRSDLGPGLRRFLGARPGRPKPVVPASSASYDRLAGALRSVGRYHACHRPASVRMGVAGLLLLVGTASLTSPRYRRAEARPRAGTHDPPDDGFLRGFGYQPALDGLRAVAISWVLLTHTGLKGWFVTGDHGVDLFFVLSGFLITTLLLREHANRRRISLGQFYIRRALRLLPVILLAVAFGALARIAAPGWFWSPKWSGLAAILLYVSNWMHIRDGYSLGFLTPTWSLAIEEQFYLVWPPILASVLALGRGRRGVALLAGYGAVAAAFYRWSTSRGDSGASASYSWYYDSFKRADALLLGCLLAAVLSPTVVRYLRGRAPQVSWLAALGLIGVVYVCARQIIVDDESFLPSWGLIVLELSFALIVCSLVILPAGRLATVFSAPWLVWLGRRSYGLYVLHVPVFAAAQRLGLHAYYLMAVEIPLSLAAAALSYRFIEAPALRLKGRFGGKAL